MKIDKQEALSLQKTGMAVGVLLSSGDKFEDAILRRVMDVVT